MHPQSVIFRAAILAKSVIQATSPFKTGNLRYNAIRISNDTDKEASIFADVKIAPYMPYTTEPWTSPKWRGKRNPNEGWWNTATNRAMQAIGQSFGGTVRRKN